MSISRLGTKREGKLAGGAVNTKQLEKGPFGPWNPGLESQIPRRFAPLSSLFRPQNIDNSFAEAEELAAFCGLSPQELALFGAERLMVHDLLVRLSADFSVPDGNQYEDLGINFRAMATRIHHRHLAAHAEQCRQRLADLRRHAATFIAEQLTTPPAAAAPARAGLLARLSAPFTKPEAPSPPGDPTTADMARIASWRQAATRTGDDFCRACLAALARAGEAIVAARGRLVADTDIIVRIATIMVSNELGARRIAAAIAPVLSAAADQEGYRLLPRQDKPVVMNVKGASAAGKSTLRPLQKALARRIGVPWRDFALISPDIWRKYLLDYDSLGEAVRYAGPLTGHELEIIDRKLDRHMAAKAAGGDMSHLLIDRFRFDSFVPEGGGDEPARLLTRFGHLVYMFFMITPPEATVERAWKRGLEFGRYKAVDDLLAHNVEAYEGMPQLFFTWALRTDRRVHYEFLDNSVAKGARPRTVAFGWNGEMTILDVEMMMNVDRYRCIDVAATRPQEVYTPQSDQAFRAARFLADCARLMPVVNFADQASGRVFARLEGGRWRYRDDAWIAANIDRAEVARAIRAAGHGEPTTTNPPPALSRAGAHTLGAWGQGSTR